MGRIARVMARLFGTKQPAPAPVLSATVPSTLSAGARAEVEVLVAARIFARGPVGIVGMPPAELLAAERLATQADAIAACEWLVVRGSSAGRLYAYWALLGLDRARAALHAAALGADAAVVSTMAGCSMLQRTVAEVAADAPQWASLVGVAAGEHEQQPADGEQRQRDEAHADELEGAPADDHAERSGGA
jgi:hypothetical protein